MKIKAQNSQIQGNICIPPSKSQTMRALLLGASADGISRIKGVLASLDTNRLIHCLKLYGASFVEEKDHLQIQGTSGRWKMPNDVLDVGNSGIALRFLTAIAANTPSYTLITGDASIREQRPMGSLLKGLNQLGVFAVSSCENDFAPLIIKGPIVGDYAKIDGEDSQPVSALMIAAALSKKTLKIHVVNMGEKPWVLLTAKWLETLGVEVVFNGNEITVSALNALKPFDYKVPGDMSSAAFPAALALVTKSEINIEGLTLNDGQGDARFFQIVQEMGAHIDWNENSLRIQGKELHGIDVDVNDCIDSIAALSVVACFAKGKTVIKNAHGARFKECNRIHVLATELKKMGADIIEREDGLEIIGSKLYGSKLSSHNDHRMAMAFIVAGLGAEGETIVEGCSCIEKTYSSFVEDIQRLGGNLSLC